MPPIRPSQLLTLKPLDPLDQEPQRGENHDHQADIQHVKHGALLRVPGRDDFQRTRFAIQARPGTDSSRLCTIYAPRRGVLTERMQAGSLGSVLGGWTTMTRVLVVDDEPQIIRALR